MSIFAGKDGALKIEDTEGSDTFTLVAGLRTFEFSIENELIDITNYGSSQDREILGNAGIQSGSVSASGLLDDGAQHTRLRTVIQTGALTTFQITDGTNTYEFVAKVTNYSQSYEYNSAVGFSATLEISGALTIT